MMRYLQQIWSRRIVRGLIYVVVISLTTYFSTQAGYCQSWWGRDNLIFRTYWACACNAELENSFFPDDKVTVLFEGCANSYVANIYPEPIRYMFIGTNEAPSGSVFLDLSPYNIKYLPPAILSKQLLLLDDSWWYTSDKETSRLWNWRTDEEIEVNRLDQHSIQSIIDSSTKMLNTSELAKLYENIDYVYVGNRFILFVDTSKGEGNHSHLLFESEIPSDLELKSILESGFAPYKEAPFASLHGSTYTACRQDIVSPNGRFVATRDGIFTTENNRQLIDTDQLIPNKRMESWLYRYEPIGYMPCMWSEDSTYVIYDYDYRGIDLVGLEPTSIPFGIRNRSRPIFPVPILQINLPTIELEP